MKKISLQEHIAQSKIAVAANLAKGNRHGQILSMLYADPFHFIEELIQNAEDALARNKNNAAGFVKIVLHENGIHFFHNGAPFNEPDLMSITTFASTTKKGLPDVNQIGKFGIGFRSVFGITDEPEIHSGPYHYKITDFEVLEETTPLETGEYTTHIYLPYKKTLSESFKQELARKILDLNPRLLLFLQQIVQVTIVAESQHVIMSAATEVCGKKLQKREISVDKNNHQSRFQYIVFSRNPGRLNETSVALAIDDQFNFVKEHNPVVSVYFPTQFRIDHDVLIHGRFTTTPNRENIPFSKEIAPENAELLSDLGELMKTALQQLLKEKKLNAAFYQLFSWNQHHADPVSAAVSDSIQQFIHDEKCLEGASGKLFNVSDLCVPENVSLENLLKGNEIAAIFSRLDFICNPLVYNDSFIQYLKKNHKLKTADIDSFTYHISHHSDFLQKKPLNWFVELYRFLAQHPRLWNQAHAGRYYNIRHSACIPDQHRVPCVAFSKTNQPLIFIGKPAKGIPAVHPLLTENQDSLEFLIMFGIPGTMPGLSESEKLMLRFSARSAHQWWLKLFELFTNSDNTVKDRLKEKIHNMACVPVQEPASADIQFVAPTEACLPMKSLKDFYSGQQVYFISEKLLKFFASNNIAASSLYDMLSQFGVQSSIVFMPFAGTLSDDEKKRLREGKDEFSIIRETITDFSIAGLDAFLCGPKPASSAALWKLLMQVPSEFRQASYTFESYVRSESSAYTPEYMRKLQNTSWLYDKNMRLRPALNLSLNELHPMYEPLQADAQWLAETLGMMSDGLSNEEKNILELLRTSQINISSLTKLLAENKNETSFIEYLSAESGAESTMQTDIKFNLFAAASIAHFPAQTQNWHQHLFQEKTDVLKNHLLSQGQNTGNVQPGWIQSVDIKGEKQMHFVGLLAGADSGLLMPDTFVKCFSEKNHTENLMLWVFDLPDQTCMRVDSAQLNDYLKNRNIITLQPIQLKHD